LVFNQNKWTYKKITMKNEEHGKDDFEKMKEKNERKK